MDFINAKFQKTLKKWMDKYLNKLNRKAIKKNKRLMKNLIKTILLTIAIYSGAVAANSDDVNIWAAVICAAACSTFVIIKDNN